MKSHVAIVTMLVAGACVAHHADTETHARASAGVGCPSAQLDSSDWETATLFAVGVSVRHPRDYIRKNWERQTDTLVDLEDFWKDDRPRSMVSILSGDSAYVMKFAPRRSPAALSCRFQTSSGPTTAIVQRTVEADDSTRPLFTIEVPLRARQPGRLVLFTAWATDSAEFTRQLSIARSIRLLGIASQPLLAIRLASESSGPRFPSRHDLTVDGVPRAYYLSADDIVSDTDVTAARTRPAPDGIVVEVQLSDAAAARLRQATADNVGSYLAVLARGRLAAAATIVQSVPRENRITLGLMLPAAVADSVRSEVSGRWPGLRR